MANLRFPSWCWMSWIQSVDDITRRAYKARKIRQFSSKFFCSTPREQLNIMRVAFLCLLAVLVFSSAVDGKKKGAKRPKPTAAVSPADRPRLMDVVTRTKRGDYIKAAAEGGFGKSGTSYCDILLPIPPSHSRVPT